MEEKERHLVQIKKQQNRSLSQKREENQKRQTEKRRNVSKILRQQERERAKTLKNIENRNRCITALQREKADLLEKRKIIRQRADIKKQQIFEKFEEMKCKNKVNFKTLSKLGIEIPDREKIRENLKARTTLSTFSRTDNYASTTVSQRNMKQSSFETTKKPDRTMRVKTQSMDAINNTSTNQK